jgi:hypothetical protein
MTQQKGVADERSAREIFEDRMFELNKRVRASRFNEEFLAKVNPGLQLLMDGGEVLMSVKPSKVDWLTKIIEAEHQAHLDFFGQKFDLTGFEKTLQSYGRKKIRFWKSLGLEPHFLPKISMMTGDEYPGWKVKPEQWFYKMLFEGKLFFEVNGKLEKITTCELPGIVALIDTRLKPGYDNGKQMWEKDNFLGEIIKKMRQQKKLADYSHQASRFGISASEADAIKPFVANKLGLESNQIRLETTIERNAIPQIFLHMPRKEDGKTNTSVWTEEYFDGRDNRLSGGDSDSGGLAYVYAVVSGGRWVRRSFRFLAVL